jgi:phosphoribosylformylglycinamidine (FGAM) synthase-like enzyme
LWFNVLLIPFLIGMYISIYSLYLFDSFAAARIHVADVVDEKSAVVRVAMKICIALTSVPVGQKSLLVKTRNKVRRLRRMQMLGKMHLIAIKRPSRFLTARLR